ncbi:putative flippase (Putative export protein) [Escherichia coli]|uniref:Putative flippase (Putative export protein) n=1 Tax=Escherichia coli TaxID=562 RepID=A0A376LLB4_ECOLX|nr:putative flippase (Putative export protein) [Escherichia coli]
MSLREKTISGAKWSAIATVIIIGLGLVQMTVLARIIDNHQFGLLTVSLVIIALADTLSDFGIANSIIQRKEISHPGTYHVVLAERRAGACGVRGGVFVE